MSETPKPLHLHKLMEAAMARLVHHRIALRDREDYDAELFEVHFSLSDIKDYQMAGGQLPPFDQVAQGEVIAAEIDNINGTRIQVHTKVKPDQAWIMYDGEILETVEHPGQCPPELRTNK